jgi:hypothetical protein
MTTSLSAALRMPNTVSVAAPPPMAFGASAEPCALRPAFAATHRSPGAGLVGIIAPAFAGRLGGKDGSGRFGGSRSGAGSAWDRQDSARLAGGGPLRG